MKKTTLGVIFGNRDFFPDHLVTSARADIEKLFAAEGLRAVMLSEKDSKLGGVESHADAARCADLFKGHGAEIDGVLVVLPNFGDEKGVADALKLAGLDVPVLVQGYPDELEKLDPGQPPRRVLRQDLCLQQPPPVRHLLHRHREAHRAPGERELPRGPPALRRPSAGWCGGCDRFA